jgi:hypothetical protein
MPGISSGRIASRWFGRGDWKARRERGELVVLSDITAGRGPLAGDAILAAGGGQVENLLKRRALI